MSTLLLEFWTEGKNFCIYAEAGDFEKELTLTGQAKTIVSHFDTVYDILEEKPEGKVKVLQEALEMLSEILLPPFAKELGKCSSVRFVVYEDLIRCAFDLLLFEGNYLFLQKRVCYQVAEGEGEDAPKIPLGSALLIADLTADPEEACKAVSKLIPDAHYEKMEDASFQMIKEAASEVDALIVSAHGDLEDGGGVYLNDS